MKRILGAGCAVLVLAALAPAQAWANPQHERMKRCNAEAKEQALKGEARKAFMGTCLRGKHDAAAPAAAVPAQAGAGAPAQAAAPAPAAVAPAVAAPAVAAESVQKVSSEDKARQKACNRAATEQSLRGAKRKAFIGECMSG
ncbi:MAG: PsiF repeat-containing protein [Thauera sp.]|uniref:PsiF family protein n=1 Tax=Thauera sp. TaxID=1905334 RepID=UPI001D7D7147|nr:PsiF family protein [Thauera sp.]MCB1945104.1 PsiF repeat-containing protein [Thauera sp.]MCP5226442.1 PsiF repeat-containing protein [Thauera sp.]